MDKYDGRRQPESCKKRQKIMLSHKITSVSAVVKNDVLNLTIAGRTIKLYKVLATLGNLEWKYKE